MPVQARLEVNGAPVRNRVVRAVLSTVILITVAILLVALGVILLPLFIGLIALLLLAGTIILYRFRRRMRAFSPDERGGNDAEDLDPSLRVHIDSDSNRASRSHSQVHVNE